MELWLEVTTPAKDRHDVAVDLGPEATIGHLRNALRRHFDLGDPIRLFISRLGRTIDDGDGIALSHLRFGDRIEIRAGISGTVWEAPNRISLTAAGGPGSGLRFELGDGDHAIGRDPTSPIWIPDAAMSKHHAAIRVRPNRLLVADAGSSNGTFVDGARIIGPHEVHDGQTIECGHTTLLVTVHRVDEHPHPAVKGRISFERSPRMVKPVPERRFILPAPPARSTGRGRRRSDTELAAFEAKVAALSAEMSLSLDEETTARRSLAPDMAELLHRVRTLAPTLWERRTNHGDFLSVRIGTADLPSLASVEVAEGGDELARARALETLARWSTVRAAPVELDIARLGVVGLAGEAEAVAGLARTVLVQTAVLHTPREVVVTVAVGDDERDDWGWAIWLPHLRADNSPVAGPHLAVGERRAAQLVDAIRAVVAMRRAESVHRPAPAETPMPSIILFLSSRLAISPAALDPILDDGPLVGVYVVRVGGTVTELSGSCAAVVHVQDRPSSLRVTHHDATSGFDVERAIADLVPIEVARDLAQRLSCVRDVTAARGRRPIPRRVSLVDLLDLTELSPSRIRERWSRSAEALAAPIGMSANGPFLLDLRTDGPHILIGGTTGAGKSGLLQTLVASLAASHPPDRITFLIVDLTGGSASSDVVPLPHTVGFVTNFDAHLVTRVVTSLEAELQRREQLLLEHGVRDLAELERRVPPSAPPSLVLIIDEVATLVSDLPDLVDDIVNVARRGRSLGIHLILATQRPAGVIDDLIRANTNLRIALRMNDAADSNDIIGTSDAALLPRTIPGRAFARSGQAELTELQVAFVDGQTVIGESASTEVAIRDLSDGVAERRDHPPADGDGARTDLQRIVDAISHAARESRIPPQPQPWLPPLPDLLPLWSLEPPDRRRSIPIGLVDLPREQLQRTWGWNPDEHGGLLVFGPSGSGTTTFLRTLAVSAAQVLAPTELLIHVPDFAAPGLSALDAIPHVGAVLSGFDDEAVDVFLGWCEEEALRRRQLLADEGVTSFEAHRNRGGPDALPRLVVLVDTGAGVDPARAAIDRAIERLLRLVPDGRSLGLHVVLATNRPAASFGSFASSTMCRIALGTPAGRGRIESTTELQVAIVGSEPGAGPQDAAVRHVSADLRRRHGHDAPSSLR